MIPPRRDLTWARMPPSTSSELTFFKADDRAFKTVALSWAVILGALVIQSLSQLSYSGQICVFASSPAVIGL